MVAEVPGERFEKDKGDRACLKVRFREINIKIVPPTRDRAAIRVITNKIRYKIRSPRDLVLLATPFTAACPPIIMENIS
jgi:hypothetical protein